MSNANDKAWENFLNPDIIRPSLIIASLYIAAYELLKNTVVDRIKTFFMVGIDQHGVQIDSEYASEVQSRNASPTYASLDWLKEMKAIDENDVEVFERVKKTRNCLAHEIVNLLTRGLPPDLHIRFSEMVALIDKIEKWWIVNVEIPVNPDFDGKDIDTDGILPGPVMGLRALMDIALGSEADSKRYLDEFLRRKDPGVK